MKESRKGESTASESFQTASEIAYDIISRKILEGDLKPGVRLSRRKMAELTGVSVIPVIEALKKLEEDRLVESKPQWGSFVTVPTLEKIKEVYQYREAMECQIARMLSKTLTPEQRQEISVFAKELDNTRYDIDTYGDMREAHFKFHYKLAEYSGNALIISSIKRINLFWILCKALMAKRPTSPSPRYWHLRLIDVIAEGDPDKAEAMMREHIYDSLDAIEENWGKEGGIT